jgi:hypothetical protein
VISVLQPLRPQSPARVAWECKLLNTLSTRMDCTYSDAAAFIEAHPAEVDELYAAGARAVGAADVLFNMDAGA